MGLERQAHCLMTYFTCDDEIAVSVAHLSESLVFDTEWSSGES